MSDTFDETSMTMLFEETTSPSQLDEAMGQTFCEAFARPTTSKASPIRGRTMKDYEEKQAQLKKENFNLKLRIYFLEERMGQIAGLKDKEEAIKSIIELKVENESMRKELSGKQELLCQAAKALDLLEEQRKDEKSKCSALENRIQELERELQDCASSAQQIKFSAMTQSTDSQYSSACFEVDQLTAQLQELQEQNREDKSKISLLETELQNLQCRCETYETLLNSKKEVLSKLEEVTGVKEEELNSKVQKLLDCGKLVLELQDELRIQQDTKLERESRHSKVKAHAANIMAKLNTANLELDRLREEIKSLKKQRQEDLRRRSSECTSCVSTKQSISEKLDEKSKELESKSHVVTQNAVIMRQLMSELTEARDQVKMKDAIISELKQKANAAKLEGGRTREKVSSNELAPLAQDKEYILQSIEARLKEKESQLVACEQRLEAKDNRIQELELEIQSLQKEYNQVSEADSTFNPKPTNREIVCDDPSHKSLFSQLSDKGQEIETLNMELRKRTFNLQELVNKELWDKNKQIERLELRLAAQGSVCSRKELDLKEAKRKLAELGVTVASFPQHVEITPDDVSELQEQLKISLEEQKYLCKEVDSLKERLRNTPERDSESPRLQKLILDKKRLQVAEENHKMWRREASKALSVLRTRLEELAIFLDELLHQPALAVSLCADRQRVLRAAINGSLELSRTIANLSSESLPDDSCSHLHCTGNGSLYPFSYEDAESTCNNPFGNKTTCDSTTCCVSPKICTGGHRSPTTVNSPNQIKCERQDHLDQILDVTHKTEYKVQQSSTATVRTRRRSRSQPQGSLQMKSKDNVSMQKAGSQSDSEAWSEPDRSVSQARMGIHNESSRTTSSVASTVRKVSTGGQSSSSSCDATFTSTNPPRCTSGKDLTNSEDNKLTVRTHCLEKLNQALENELQSGLPSHHILPGKSNGVNSSGEISPRPICVLPGSQCMEKEEDLSKMSVVRTDMNTEEKCVLYTKTMHELEEKVQELSVQVLEVEIRREQAELDAQQARQEKTEIQRDFESKLMIAENRVEQARNELSALQVTTKQALGRQHELEIEVNFWKERARDIEVEIEKWKRVAQKCELDVKEARSQLSHVFKEKLTVLEQSRKAAEQNADGWLSKFNEAEAKCLEVSKRAKEKVRLMEEQLKLKQAEIERHSEELQEKLKREAEIRASRKLDKVVEQRMAEYDLESRAAANKRLRDLEAQLMTRISDLEMKAADSAADAQQKIQELSDSYRVKESEWKEKIMQAECNNPQDGELQHQLNEAAVAVSQAQLETAKLANEKLQLEQQVRWLQGEAARDRKQLQDQLTSKIISLTQANSELQKRVRDLEREIHQSQFPRCSQPSVNSSVSSGGKVLTEITNLKPYTSDVSDYVSEHERDSFPDNSYPCWFKDIPPSPPAVVLSSEGNTISVANCAGRVSTASPDLGIESDQGRFSSLEPFPLKKSTTAPALNAPDIFPVVLHCRKKQQLDYKGLEQENQELKQRLLHTRQTLEQTYAQLAAANQRKRLVEKAICKQLHKTHHILRRARDNFETNSSTPQEEDGLK